MKGVCDCCDGSDEIGSPFDPKCENLCVLEQLEAKQIALNRHRVVQSGLRKKKELMHALEIKKKKEEKSHFEMKKDKNEILSILMQMKIWHGREIVDEEKWRWKLIREREARCASGFLDSCNFFSTGWMNDDELLRDGYPVEYANPRTRLRNKLTDKDIDRLKNLRGLERIRGTMCDVDDIMPDVSLRVQVTAGEYLTFYSTEAGIETKKKNPTQVVIYIFSI